MHITHQTTSVCHGHAPRLSSRRQSSWRPGSGRPRRRAPGHPCRRLPGGRGPGREFGATRILATDPRRARSHGLLGLVSVEYRTAAPKRRCQQPESEAAGGAIKRRVEDTLRHGSLTTMPSKMTRIRGSTRPRDSSAELAAPLSGAGTPLSGREAGALGAGTADDQCPPQAWPLLRSTRRGRSSEGADALSTRTNIRQPLAARYRAGDVDVDVPPRPQAGYRPEGGRSGQVIVGRTTLMLPRRVFVAPSHAACRPVDQRRPEVRRKSSGLDVHRTRELKESHVRAARRGDV